MAYKANGFGYGQGSGIRDQGLKNGFSLLELIIVIGILVMIVPGMLFILRSQILGNLDSDSLIVSARLTDAQMRAIAGVGGSNWGMHFENPATSSPFYAIFAGTSYAGVASSTYFLSNAIEFQSPASGAATDIVFNKLSGTAMSADSIVIRLKSDPSMTKTITVTTGGKISVE